MLYGPGDNLNNLLIYIDGFFEDIGLKAEIDVAACRDVVTSMENEFPHKDGLEKASPFKKIAFFTASFIAERPIKTKLSEMYIGDVDISTLSNHQNVIVAINMAIKSLHGAEIKRCTGETIHLDNEIKLSSHSYCDLIDALRSATPNEHFKILSVLFEQLVYRYNPDASYPVC